MLFVCAAGPSGGSGGVGITPGATSSVTNSPVRRRRIGSSAGAASLHC